MFTDVFLDQKRVNVCELTVKTALKLSFGAVFTVCSNTFTLFWSRKTSVTVETFQLGFRVFMCAFHPKISFVVRVSSFFPLFLCYPYFVILSALSPWHMEPGGQSLHSQGLSRNPYPESNQPYSSHSCLFLEGPF